MLLGTLRGGTSSKRGPRCHRLSHLSSQQALWMYHWSPPLGWLSWGCSLGGWVPSVRLSWHETCLPYLSSRRRQNIPDASCMALQMVVLTLHVASQAGVDNAMVR